MVTIVQNSFVIVLKNILVKIMEHVNLMDMIILAIALQVSLLINHLLKLCVAVTFVYVINNILTNIGDGYIIAT